MRPVLAVTMGDPAGIGAEISVKALEHEEVYRECIPYVIGDRCALENAVAFTGGRLKLRSVEQTGQLRGEFGTVEYFDSKCLRKNGWEYGKVSAACGNAAFQYIKKAIELALKHEVLGVVTAPINKEALHKAGYRYSGHTEIFADLTGCKKYAMMLLGRSLRVIHVTTHVPLRRACDLVKRDRVRDVIQLAHDALGLMGIPNPRIAVAGLNPHSSEDGLFGDEEEKEIIPAIRDAARLGICVEGPVPPDTVFVKAVGGQYDIVVAMYHDQGHIPMKLCGFKMDPATRAFTSVSGVNCTVGLPIIRTSVDHGTAFDKAATGTANEESMVEAIGTAARMAKRKYALS